MLRIFCGRSLAAPWVTGTCASAGDTVGVCVALERALRGARVTLLERGAELAWGCSSGNAGLTRPSHYTPLANPASLRDGTR